MRDEIMDLFDELEEIAPKTVVQAIIAQDPEVYFNEVAIAVWELVDEGMLEVTGRRTLKRTWEVA